MNTLDLFSGIGGFALGLERAGFKVAGFCEIEPYCQRILRQNFSGVPIFDDITTLTADQVRERCGAIDIITGGFPCQDISIAGKQTGITGDRSSLWFHYARLIGELGPEFAIVENVTNLLSGQRGTWFGRVLGDLAKIGYDAEWHCIPASAVGAPHQRDRVWIIAYPNSERCKRSNLLRRPTGKHCPSRLRQDVPNPNGTGSQIRPAFFNALASILRTAQRENSENGWWATEPDICRVVNGLPGRVDRIKGLGNSVVPQIPEMIGRVILESKNEIKALSKMRKS